MAINFEAANMAGYNNPKIVVLNAEVGYNSVISAPKYSDVEKICRSGFVPVINATDTASGNSMVLQLAAISAAGDYLFSCTLTNPQTLTPMLPVLAFFKETGAATFSAVPLQPASK